MSAARSLGCAFAIGLMLAGPVAADNTADPIYVFAAASMTEAVDALATGFGRATGHRLRTSFASSSTLARQIEAGAPADVFISANRRWMAYLKEYGHIDAGTVKEFAGNRLVVIVSAGGRLDDLADLTGRNLAMGDPDHVPAGIYARRFLEQKGLWHGVAADIARTKDVRAALALVARGEAEAGIVYRTDARISDQVKVAFEAAIDPNDPIVYEIAVVSGAARPVALSFTEYVLSADGQAILSGLGFVGVADLGATKP